MTERLSRRQAIAGAAIAGVGVPLLAACGSDSNSPAGDGTVSDNSSGGTGGPLTTTAAVTVGSGVILEAPAVVITQPTEGDFKGFSSICTHQGCPVTDFVEGNIHCACHGGLALGHRRLGRPGTTTKALAPFAIKVEGGDIVAG